MDGVIVDTEPVHSYAFHTHFKNLGIDVSDDLYATLLGKSTKNVYENLKAQFGLSESVEDLINQKRSIFNEAFDHKPDLFLIDGVEKLIKDLYDNGIQLILASSSAKQTINRVFKRFGLHPYFTDIVSGEDFPKSKPDPAIFIHAASLSKAPKENCLVIEDSSNGIKAAKAAGLFCIGYDSIHSKMQDLSEADVVIRDFSELSFEKVLSIEI